MNMRYKGDDTCRPMCKRFDSNLLINLFICRIRDFADIRRKRALITLEECIWTFCSFIKKLTDKHFYSHKIAKLSKVHK